MRLIVIALVCGLASAAFADHPAASGPLKAYKGPEGQIVALVPVSDGKQMLVFVRGLGGGIDGTSRLYEYEDLGNDRKTVYWNRKAGSKTHRAYVLTDYEPGSWNFIDPAEPATSFRVKYDEASSKQIKVEDVVNAYKP
jgi:hypothetical protein